MRLPTHTHTHTHTHTYIHTYTHTHITLPPAYIATWVKSGAYKWVLTIANEYVVFLAGS